VTHTAREISKGSPNQRNQVKDSGLHSEGHKKNQGTGHGEEK
jgi:hypothetical protein